MSNWAIKSTWNRPLVENFAKTICVLTSAFQVVRFTNEEALSSTTLNKKIRLIISNYIALVLAAKYSWAGKAATTPNNMSEPKEPLQSLNKFVELIITLSQMNGPLRADRLEIVAAIKDFLKRAPRRLQMAKNEH
jgi:hypothetical protein